MYLTNFYDISELLYYINPTQYYYIQELTNPKLKFNIDIIDCIYRAIYSRYINIFKKLLSSIPKDYKSGVYYEACKSGSYGLIDICEKDGMKYGIAEMEGQYTKEIFAKNYKKSIEIIKSGILEDTTIMYVIIMSKAYRLFNWFLENRTFNTDDWFLFCRLSIMYNSTEITKYILTTKKFNSEQENILKNSCNL